MQSSAEVLSEALAHDKAGQPDDAERLCRRILSLDAEHVGARLLLASLCQRSGRFDETVEHVTRVLQSSPDHAPANYLLGVALAKQGKLDEAIASLEHAERLEPNLLSATENLRKLRSARACARGRALAAAGNAVAAESHFRDALRHNPNSVEAHSELARAMAMQSRIDEAQQHAQRAVELAPNAAETHCNLAFTLTKQVRIDEALHCLRRAIELQPNNGEFHSRYGRALLLAGRFQEGWAEFEWRWQRPGEQEANPTRPVWNGEALDGRTIVLSSEQGLGDTIQFVRYAQLVKQRGGTVVVESQPPLTRLLTTCPGVDQVVARWQPLPHYDLVAPLLSLPRIFNTSLESIPAEVPYLSAGTDETAKWQSRLSQEAALRVGIAWRGSPLNAWDADRSIPLDAFSDLATTAGVQLHSIQFAPGGEELAASPLRDRIVNLTDQLGDFYHTAAIVRNLDLVITCDSAPAHLAGALGVPVWVAVTFAPDWRWMLGRQDTPWYPTMRLFRQTRPGDWAGVFSRIRESLIDLSSRQPGREP